MVPERVTTKERLEQLRGQVAHHLIVGLLFDKAPMVTAEVERSLFDMQLNNPLLKFVIVEDSSVVPEAVVHAISPIVLIRHPIFEAHLGYYDNVIITYREDGTSIDDELTVQNINKLFVKGRFNFIDGMNGWKITEGNFEKPIVSIIVNHVSINEIGKNIQLYKNLAKLIFDSGVNKFTEYEFAIINALEVKEVSSNFQLEQFHPNRNFFLAIF
jgi:hypothetical protein